MVWRSFFSLRIKRMWKPTRGFATMESQVISPCFQRDVTLKTRWHHFECKSKWYHYENKLGCHMYIALESRWYHSGFYTIIDFWWGLLKTASGIGWSTPKAEVNQYLTRSTWSWVDRNQNSIIALLNYQEFSFTKIQISIITMITAFYCAL